MKYGYKVIRSLSMAALRQLCIEQDWYTNGDNYDYSNMLFKANKEDITSDDIVEIATDIIEHSSNLTLDDFMEVCDLILSKSYSFISEI
jgi:hypothetical protein